MLGDDVATQIDMMISPALWRAALKPRARRGDPGRQTVNPEFLIFYHGDGNMERIVPDLIEIGRGNPQPGATRMHGPAADEATFGDHLAFWGCIGTQTTMPFGTPEEVQAHR